MTCHHSHGHTSFCPEIFSNNSSNTTRSKKFCNYARTIYLHSTPILRLNSITIKSSLIDLIPDIPINISLAKFRFLDLFFGSNLIEQERFRKSSYVTFCGQKSFDVETNGAVYFHFDLSQNFSILINSLQK